MIIPWITRRWRGKGHGIHSPFAYWFVTEVLNVKDRKGFMPLLTRIADHLAPDRIVAQDSTVGELLSRNQYACGKETKAVTQCAALVVVCAADSVPPESVPDNSVIVFEDKRTPLAKSVLKEIGGKGMLFEGRRRLIVCTQAHLPRQQYNVKIRS